MAFSQINPHYPPSDASQWTAGPVSKIGQECPETVSGYPLCTTQVLYNVTSKIGKNAAVSAE
jgi:hypothetical protein